jgi:hypothetical protein
MIDRNMTIRASRLMPKRSVVIRFYITSEDLNRPSEAFFFLYTNLIQQAFKVNLPIRPTQVNSIQPQSNCRIF